MKIQWNYTVIEKLSSKKSPNTHDFPIISKLMKLNTQKCSQNLMKKIKQNLTIQEQGYLYCFLLIQPKKVSQTKFQKLSLASNQVRSQMSYKKDCNFMASLTETKILLEGREFVSKKMERNKYSLYANQILTRYNQKLDNYYDQNDSFIDDGDPDKGDDSRMIVPSAIFEDYCCVKGGPQEFVNSKEFEERRVMREKLFNRIVLKSKTKQQEVQQPQIKEQINEQRNGDMQQIQKKPFIFGFDKQRKLYDDEEIKDQQSKVIFQDDEMELLKVDSFIGIDSEQQLNEEYELRNITSSQNEQINELKFNMKQQIQNTEKKMEAYSDEEMEIPEVTILPETVANSDGIPNQLIQNTQANPTQDQAQPMQEQDSESSLQLFIEIEIQNNF